MKLSNFVALITIPVFLLTGCNQKENEATIFNSADYAVLKEIKGTVSQDYAFNEYVDEVLGFKKFTFMTFVTNKSVYDQIALECIHKGVLKSVPKKDEFDPERFNKNKELAGCVRDVIKRPISIDTALYSSLLGINSLNEDQELQNLISDAKKDNVLTIQEYLQIGILTNQKWQNRPTDTKGQTLAPEIEAAIGKPVDTSQVDNSMKKVSQYINHKE
ncbi:hypothetical protein ACQWTT_001207 [Acinetobacter baumannii]